MCWCLFCFANYSQHVSQINYFSSHHSNGHSIRSPYLSSHKPLPLLLRSRTELERRILFANIFMNSCPLDFHSISRNIPQLGQHVSMPNYYSVGLQLSIIINIIWPLDRDVPYDLPILTDEKTTTTATVETNILIKSSYHSWLRNHYESQLYHVLMIPYNPG